MSTMTSVISDKIYDIAIIGGGIIGTAIARALKIQLKNSKVLLLEKEKALGLHQTGHNSTVIHAGIYYKPETLKAKFCVRGLELTYDYCHEKRIPVNKTGKLIIANTKLETYQLKELYRNAIENRVPGLELLEHKSKIREIQPHCNCSQALWSPNTGNVDWKLVTESLGSDFTKSGGDLRVNCLVKDLQESYLSTHPVRIVTDTCNFFTKFVVLAMGLRSDSLLPQREYNNRGRRMSFRVNYGILVDSLGKFIRTNIYGMPSVDLPFLGVHFSPTTDGKVLVGPCAVPAFNVEGYSYDDVDFNYVLDLLSDRSIQLMAVKNFTTCLTQCSQYLSVNARAKLLKEFVPSVSKWDIREGPQAVQTQIIDERGDFFDDFLIEIFQGKGLKSRIVNCKFIPSPGASSALAIADFVSTEVSKRFP